MHIGRPPWALASCIVVLHVRMGDRSGGWTNFYAGVRLWLLMLEIARRSGGVAFLLVVLILGLYPLVADYFPGLSLWASPITFENA